MTRAIVSMDKEILPGYRFDFERLLDDTVYLTDEHAASSYGLPVLTWDGRAFGPGDLPPTTLLLLGVQPDAERDEDGEITSTSAVTQPVPAAFAQAAQDAGWTVELRRDA